MRKPVYERFFNGAWFAMQGPDYESEVERLVRSMLDPAVLAWLQEQQVDWSLSSRVIWVVPRTRAHVSPIVCLYDPDEAILFKLRFGENGAAV